MLPAFKVVYIFVILVGSNPPLPSTPVDEFIGELVRLYYKRKPLVEQVKNLLTKNGEKDPPTRTVNRAIQKTILYFWANIGGKEFAYGKKDESYKKMVEHLEKQNVKGRSTK